MTPGDTWGHLVSGVTQLPGAVGGPSALTSSLVPTLLSFLRRASLASCSVSLTSCLMNPPGMTESSRGGAEGGGPRSSSRICVWEHRGVTGTGAQAVSGSRAEHQHPAQAEALPSTRGAPACVRDAVGAEAARRKAQREAPGLVQPSRAGAAGAQGRCQLCASSPGMATAGTIPAAARQAAAPASPQPHAALQPLCARPQGETSPTSRSFSSSSTSIKPCSLLPGSPRQGKNHSNQNTQAGREPRARGQTQHKGGCGDVTPGAAAVTTPSSELPGSPSTQPQNTTSARLDRDFPSAPRGRGGRRWPWWRRGRTVLCGDTWGHAGQRERRELTRGCCWPQSCARPAAP